MNIKHDAQWFENDTSSFNGNTAAVIYAVRYHEHMTRWRELQELPEIGQRIEIAWRDKTTDGYSWSSVDTFSGNYDDEFEDAVCGIPYAWRPVGALPE